MWMWCPNNYVNTQYLLYYGGLTNQNGQSNVSLGIKQCASILYFYSTNLAVTSEWSYAFMNIV